MKYYTETIPLPLAKKLKEKGMPMEEGGKSIIDWKIPTYSEIFDWFFKKGIEVEVYLSMTRLDAAKNPVQKIYAWNVYSRHSEANGEEDEMSWHEAANAAIEKALTLV